MAKKKAKKASRRKVAKPIAPKPAVFMWQPREYVEVVTASGLRQWEKNLKENVGLKDLEVVLDLTATCCHTFCSPSDAVADDSDMD